MRCARLSFAWIVALIACLAALDQDCRAAEGLFSIAAGHGSACGCDSGQCGGSCDSCCDDGCGHKGCHRRRAEGLDKMFNCGCNGSYKFPVPPLFTYHWPGLYSHQLMTDYHSPWRFPPIKPYVDEPKAKDVQEESGAMLLSPLRPVSNLEDAASNATRSQEPVSMSQLMRRVYR